MSTPDPTSATAGAAQVNREPAVVRVTPAGREEVAQVHHELAALGRRSPSLQLGAPLEEFAGDLGLAQWSSGSSGGVEVAIPGSGQRARGGPQTPRTVRRRSASTAPTASQVGSTTSKASSTRSASSGSTVPSTSGQASMAATSAAGVGACTHAAAHQADDGADPDVVYVEHLTNALYLDRRDDVEQYLQKPASSALLKAVWQVSGDEFAELAWMARMEPPGAPGTPPAPRQRLRVVGACVPGAVVGTAVLLGTVAVAAGAVVVGTAAGAVVVGAGTGDVVDVPGARVAGGADRSAPATTTPTEVLPPCRDRLPNKLASGWLATASTPVIAVTAIPKASTAATATRCQRIGWGPASLSPSSLASSSLAPAWSPTRRRRERRATRWADASEWVYRASAGATSRLTSAAPIRVPSTPKKDATTAPLTAASAPASNLGMRSCSIPHLEVGVGDGGAAVWGPRARPDWNPAAARVPTLATQAGSRQLPPGQGGDRAAWGSCGLGDRSFIADLVPRAELQAAHGSGGPEVAHDPEHVASPRVHQSQRACAVSGSCAEILLKDQESCSSMGARRARWLARDNARAALSNAPTNSRQIQHVTESVCVRGDAPEKTVRILDAMLREV
jgi:hypothetical protein